MKHKIPCEEPQCLGWTCNEGHLCDTCHMKEKIYKISEEEGHYTCCGLTIEEFFDKLFKDE